MPPKLNSLPLTYASVVTGEQTTSATACSDLYSQDNIDLRDLLTLPMHSNSELIVPNKLKALYTNHSMTGLLEVIIYKLLGLGFENVINLLIF